MLLQAQANGFIEVRALRFHRMTNSHKHTQQTQAQKQAHGEMQTEVFLRRQAAADEIFQTSHGCQSLMGTNLIERRSIKAPLILPAERNTICCWPASSLISPTFS